MKILFIDDDSITTEWVTIFLKSKNLEVKTANSIPAAIECLAEWVPDLIISDIRLRNQHAFTLLDFLEENNHTRNIPRVAITGLPLRPEEKIRFNGCVLKPIGSEELMHIVRRFTPGTN